MIALTTKLEDILFVSIVFLGVWGMPQILSAQENPSNNDSNADLSTGFDEVVNSTQGVILRVPLNEAGEEDTDSADMRLYKNTKGSTDPEDLEMAWNESSVINSVPEISIADIERDSSTHGIMSWHGWGWRNPYWYSHYRPHFYSYGHYWYYGSPRYYDSRRFYPDHRQYRYYYYYRDRDY